MSTAKVVRRQKIKKKHWLNRREGVPQERNLNQSINDSKSHIWNSFFEKITLDIQLFYILPHVPVDI